MAARKRRRRVFLAAVLLLAGCMALAGVHAGTGRLGFPLDTEQWKLSDGYGWRKDPLTGEDAFHRGVDFACEEGTAVLAAQDGVVTETRWSSSYGNYVQLLHSQDRETRYAHLQYVYARPGEIVAKGQLLGTAGQTGRATGTHLHFELLEHGAAKDPARALGLDDEA